MKYRIIITEQAEIDLRNIYEYIAFTLLEPEIGIRQLEKIEEAILNLDEMPTYACASFLSAPVKSMYIPTAFLLLPW